MGCSLDRFVISRCRHYPHVMKVFIRFLITHDLYGSYVLNYANAKDSWKDKFHFEGGTPNELIMRAFLWTTTPEGEGVWEDLAYLWRCMLKIDLKIEIK